MEVLENVNIGAIVYQVTAIDDDPTSAFGLVYYQINSGNEARVTKEISFKLLFTVYNSINSKLFFLEVQ